MDVSNKALSFEIYFMWSFILKVALSGRGGTTTGGAEHALKSIQPSSVREMQASTGLDR